VNEKVESIEVTIDEKSKWHWLKLIIPCLLSTGIIIISFLIVKLDLTPANTISDNQYIFKFAKQNLQEKPISSILTVNEDETCPVGYDKSNFGFWDGINSGCVCAGKVLTATVMIKSINFSVMSAKCSE
jgi:hypothetical protein